MTDKIANLLSQLADKLGTTAQYLWGVEVKQAISDGFANLIWTGIALALTITCTVIAIKFNRRITELREDKEAHVYGVHDSEIGGYAAWVTATGVIGVIFLVVAIACGISTMQHLVNPENYALQNIFSAIQGK